MNTNNVYTKLFSQKNVLEVFWNLFDSSSFFLILLRWLDIKIKRKILIANPFLIVESTLDSLECPPFM